MHMSDRITVIKTGRKFEKAEIRAEKKIPSFWAQTVFSIRAQTPLRC